MLIKYVPPRIFFSDTHSLFFLEFLILDGLSESFLVLKRVLMRFLVVYACKQLPPAQLENALNRISALKAPLIAHASQPDIQSKLPRFKNSLGTTMP